MRIFNTPIIESACKSHVDVSGSLENWCLAVGRAEWNVPQELKERYPGASIVRGDRVVFNIKGNRYRLVARINFRKRLVYVRFFGTHKKYDRINVKEV